VSQSSTAGTMTVAERLIALATASPVSYSSSVA
jgi:hypothetical protein